MQKNRNINALEPETLKKLLLWREREPGIHKLFKITETIRDKKRQYYLWLKGATSLDGEKKISQHQLGKAFDIYLAVDSYVDNNDFLSQAYKEDDPRWEKIAKSAEEYGFEWGGRWSQPWTDKPHFQNNNNVSYKTIYKKMTQNTQEPFSIPPLPEIPPEPDRVSIDNSFWNKSQETKVENVENEYRKIWKESIYWGCPRLKTREQVDAVLTALNIPCSFIGEDKEKEGKDWNTMRFLFERVAMAKALKRIANTESSFAFEITKKKDIKRIVENYIDVIEDEYKQCLDSKQKFVSEQDEEGQK